MNKPDPDLLTIRRNNLDRDCQGHPKLAFEWGENLAGAIKRVKELKNQLKVIAAEIERRVRLQPNKFLLDRVTEKALETITFLDKDYQEVQERLVEAEYEENILQAFVYALMDRKESLKSMTALHGQQYWSKPLQSSKEEQAVRARESATPTMRDKRK